MTPRSSRGPWTLYAIASSVILLCFLFVNKVTVPEPSPYVIDVTAFREVSSAQGPELAGYWTEPPNIKICSNVHVKKSRIDAAVKFWERLGYKIGKVTISDEWKYSLLGCLAAPGEITFRVPPQGLSFRGADGSYFLAITRTYRLIETSEILAADIFVQNEADYSRERIIEHELGHALGWLHHDSSYHIMHSEYQKTGHRTSGVHHNDYVADSTILITKDEK